MFTFVKDFFLKLDRMSLFRRKIDLYIYIG